jgi:hypothetical protein
VARREKMQGKYGLFGHRRGNNTHCENIILIKVGMIE